MSEAHWRPQAIYGPDDLGEVKTFKFALGSRGVIFVNQALWIQRIFLVRATTRNRGRSRGRELTVTGRVQSMHSGIGASFFVMFLNGPYDCDVRRPSPPVLHLQLHHARSMELPLPSTRTHVNVQQRIWQETASEHLQQAADLINMIGGRERQHVCMYV